MNKADLTTTVFNSLAQVLPRVDASRIDPAVNFRDQLELDSVDYLGFVLNLEKSLHIQVPQNEYPRLSSLNGCLEYLPLLVQQDDA